MHIVDVLGILIFATAGFIIYRKAWFYSFYSFVKFLLIFFLSFFFGLFISSHNPYSLPVTALQQGLIIQTIFFFVLWKFLSFKHIFFVTSRRIFDLDRFIFVHHINPFINIFPSAIASFFLTFFMFTALVSQGSGNSTLQSEIEKSTIIKPIAYDIYFFNTRGSSLNFFNGTLFKISPNAYVSTGSSFGNIKDSAILAFSQKLDVERIKAGLFTLPAFISTPEKVPGGNGTATNYNPPPSEIHYTQPTTAPYIPSPTAYNPPHYNPSYPSPTIYHYVPNPTSAAPNPYQPNPVQPTATPTLVPNPPPSQPAPQPANISQIEQDIFTLTNEQRQQNGVPPLIFDNNIAAVARAHSTDMNTRNFFNHVNPDGLDPFQRMRIGGISFGTAGENIAGGQSASIMMTNWMNSPGHRANILNRSFTKIGVGVSVSSKYGLLATQDFTN